MMKIMLAVAAAAIVVAATPLFAAESGPPQSANLKLAQIQVGPEGITVGPKKKHRRCHTVTTTVTRPDGRVVIKKERRCEDED